MKWKMMRWVFAATACAFLTSIETLFAATITVNAGNADGFTVADDGQCTLTEAINSANTNTASGASAGECAAGEIDPMVDVIEFSPAVSTGVIQTVSTLLVTGSVETPVERME